MTYRFGIEKIRAAFETARAEANPKAGEWPDAGDVAEIKAVQAGNDTDRAFWTAVMHYAVQPGRYKQSVSVKEADIIRNVPHDDGDDLVPF
jgi:hypothetical protein